MKTLVANVKYAVSILVTILIVSCIQNVSYGQAQEGIKGYTPEPRTVMLFYFLPNGRPYRADVVAAMKTGILEVQGFYAEQMAAHGYGNMTFRIRTDAQGDPVVQFVNGAHPDDHYKNTGTPGDEIRRLMDTSSIVQLVVMDISKSSGGRGVGIKQRGQAIIDGRWDWRTAAHELGHAFGLQHDFRDKSYIMSYGSGRNSLSAGAANYLAVNPYINHGIPLQAGAAPSVQLLSSSQYSYGATSVPVQVSVRDPDGLQQVTLFVKTPQGLNLPAGYNEVVSYHNLSGQIDATVTFNYKGGLPSEGDDDTSLLDQLRHTIYVSAVDKQGNRIDAPPPWTLQPINIQQAKVPVSTRSPQVRDSIYNVVRLFHDRSVSAYEHITDAHLAKIDTLFVNNIELLSSPLQYGDFDGLTNLRTLELRNVTGYWGRHRLPKDMFKGKTLLQKFSSSSYFPFDVRLQKIGTNQFKVLVPTGAPFDIELPLVITSGSINGGATSITIPTGSVESDTFTVTRTPGTTFAVTVDIEKFPSLPTGHKGYGFVKGHADLGPILKIFDALPGSFTHLNDRTPQVRDAIVKAVPEIETPDLGKEIQVLIGDTGLWYTETITYGYYANFVTEAHLAAITSLDLFNAGITALKEGDFDGLTNLTTLNLGGNDLRSLIPPIIEGIYLTPIFTKPSEIFDELTNLTTLDLSGNKLSSLPSGVFDELTNLTGLNLANNDLSSLSEDIFDELTNLTGLNLANNDLSSLPAGVFDELTNLTLLNLASNNFSSLPEDIFDELTNLIEVNLSENQLRSLPSGNFDELTVLETLRLTNNNLSSLQVGIFDELTNLTSLYLDGNDLSSLPLGVFEGFTALTNLYLQGNRGSPFSLTVSLVHVTDDQFKAVAPAGAPFDIVLPLSVTNGSISGSATSITIHTGSVDSQPLTVTRTPGTTAAVTVEIGDLLLGLPPDHQGYALVKSGAPPLEFRELEGRVFTSVSERTPEVRDAIVAAVPGVNSAADVTAAHLAAIPSFEVSLGSSVKVGDFDGLTGVTALGLETVQLTSLPAGLFNDLSNVTYMEWYSGKLITLPVGAFQGFTNLEIFGWSAIGLTSLPAGVLDPLTNLTALEISAPQLNKLPANVFDRLTNLTYLSLYAGRLKILHDDIFDQLTKLTTFQLANTELTTLPDGILDRLTALTELDLSDNQLSTLPDGLFYGLLSLTKLHLNGNTADPLPLTVSLEKVGVGQFKAVAPAGAPFDLILPINVTYGSINDGVTTLTISAGSVESDDTLTVSHTPNAIQAVAVDIGTLPELPIGVDRYGRHLHQGYTLVKSVDLPLEFGELGGSVFTPVSERTPQVRDKIVAAVPGVNSAADVTKAHLAAITGLGLGRITLFGNTVGEEITTLQAGDFDGLTGMTTLWVSSEQLSNVPAGVFDELISLEKLNLTGNFSNLPEGVFDNLTALTFLSVFSFPLNSLPADIFNELTALNTLIVAGFQLSNLPASIFDELTSLNTLFLGGQLNSLSAGIFGKLTSLTELGLGVEDITQITLPAGIFENLTALTKLGIEYEVGNPLPLTVSLEKVGMDQFKAIAPMGAPFEIVLPLTVTKGSINGVTSTAITIPTGSVESDTLTVKRTPYTTAAVTVNIGTLPGLPSDHEGYTLVKSDDLPLEFTTGLAIGITPVSQRTPQVRDAIVAAVPGVNSAADVTAAHLAAITHLDIRKKNISALKAGDFSGLSSLGSLILGGNQLHSLPEGVFSGLTALWELHLYENQLTDLPVGVFSGLTTLRTINMGGNNLTSLREDVFAGLSSLTKLWIDVNKLSSLPENVFSGLSSLSNLSLSNNQLSSLPENVFSGLSSLGVLYLGNNQLNSLPSGVFSGLSSLSTLHLFNNQLRELPDGVFSGLPNLASLFMGDNVVAPLPITVSLQKVADGQFKAVARTGAPLDIVLPINVTNGSITGGAITLTIPAGSVESETLTVKRIPGTTFAVSVDIGTLPGLPVNHRGYTLVKSADLPITMIEGDIPGTSVLTLTVGENPNDPFNDYPFGRIGYNLHPSPDWNFGTLSSPAFVIDGISYTVTSLYYMTHSKSLTLRTSPDLPRGFVLYLGSQQFNSVDSEFTYRHSGDGWENVNLNWSVGQTVQVRIVETTPMLLGPPTSLQATTQNENVMLTWELPANSDPTTLPVNEYEVRISTDGGTTWEYGWREFFDSGPGEENRNGVTFGSNRADVYYILSYGTEYTFEVRALGGDGSGDAASVTLVLDIITPLSRRTPQVRDAIVAAVPDVNSANNVTKEHLAAITSLSIWGRDITELRVEDFLDLPALKTLGISGTKLTSLPRFIFDNLPSLTELYLGGNNDLNELPWRIFDNLTALKKLYLNENGMPSLRSGVFDNLTVLEELGLGGNDLRSLPSGIFDNLTVLKKLNMSYNELVSLRSGVFDNNTALTELHLYYNDLNSLPSGIFDNNTALATLTIWRNNLSSLSAGIFDNNIALTNLSIGFNNFSSLPSGIFEKLTNLIGLGLLGNQFRSLPNGIFKGLPTLTSLNVSQNPVDPLPLTVSLEKVADGQFKAIAPTGAPIDIVLPIRVTHGSINGGATMLTIPAGSVGSDTLTVTSTSEFAVSADIGRLPSLPNNHTGYTLVKSADLPLVLTELGGQVFTSVGSRTPQVRDAIVAAVPGVNSASDVTEAHLGTITSLDLSNTSITALKAGDFDGLTALTNLNLRDNDLSSLPAGVFDGLTALTTLYLHENDLTSLLADIFDNLTALTTLYLSNNAFTTLPADIFDGLTALDSLALYANTLTSLPADIFDGLTALDSLALYANDLRSLPAGIFDGLTALTEINLGSNALTSLPADIFDGLTALRVISLAFNDLSSLPDGIFDGLAALTGIDLRSNAFTTLPAGIFEGLTALEGIVSNHSRFVRLSGNPVDPFPFTVSLQKVADGQFKAVAPAGAPFDIVLPISVTNGSITNGATTLTIPAGSVESETLTVTRTPGATYATTVNIGTLPRLPSDHSGYALVKSDDLPLEVISSEDTARQETDVNIPEPNLRAKIETALGKTSGATISATEMATLTTLNAQDSSITNLTGLETATNLTTLKLGNNTISNISALSGLTSLTELQLWDNQISNLSSLTRLTNLLKLYLWGNNISDISHLSGLTSLTQLRIGENNISNISAVSRLTNLTFLSVKENAISDISPVSGLTNLTELQIGNNTISNITPVQNLTNLEWLDMPNNTISDISAVQKLTQLVELYFQNNAVSDLSPLVANTGFGEDTEIEVRGNPLSYPSIYTHIPALQAKDVYIDFDNRVATAPVKISGDTQQDNIGATLAQPFIVEVLDGSSVAFAGVPVTFAVTAGGGTLSATNTATNANGRTQSTLTLGSTAGTNTVRVGAQGITQTTTFTATATTTPVVSVSPIINRTPQVRDAIVKAIPGVNSADDVTEAHLTAITSLNLSKKSITALKAGDFDGLSALTELRLQENQLTTLLANIFSDLSSLRTLYLNNNRLSSLPSTVFSGLSSLSNLYMNNNRLTSLPETVFSGLTSLIQINLHTNHLTSLPADQFSRLSSLTQLYLHNNRLASLSADVFSGLSSLVYLYVNNNKLTSLPTDVFSGLPSLTQLLLNNNQMSDLSADMFRGLSTPTLLWLNGNAVDPLPLTVSLEKVGLNQFKATVPAGAPFTLVLPLRIANGNISSGPASNITITAGSVESEPLTASRTPGTTAAVTVDIGTLPGLPTGHKGYQLAKSVDLPLTIISAPGNTAPVFTEGTSATRTIAENTAAGVNIGTAVAATDVDDDTLTYSLSGTNAASFTIVSASGQLQTRAVLDYETKTTYAVTIIVSDSSLTGTIAITINVTDIDETPATTAVCQVGDVLASGESCTYPGTDAVFSVLDNGSSKWNIPNLPWLNKISVGGSISFTATINEENYHFVAEEAPNDSWEIKEIGDDTSQQPVTPVTPDPPGDTGVTPTLSTSTASPLTEATLHGGIITFNLSSGTFERSPFTIRDAITLTGVSGVTVDTFGVDRVSDTQATVELAFDGNMTTDSTLSISLAADAIKDYDGTALTSQLSVSAVTESVTASTAAPLTEATLDESVVTLTLSGRKFERYNSAIRPAVSVSGISGVTVGTFDIDRESNTEITVELTFDGDITVDGTLTFTVGAGAIAGYNGPTLTAQVSVSAGTETPVVTDGQTPVTPQQPVTPEQPQQPENTGGTPTLSTSTASPLTEATLHGGIITFNLSSGTFERSPFTIRDAITLTGVSGVTVDTFGVDRVSDTQATVELAFDGNMTTDSTLSISLAADAIKDYDGTALTSQLSVSAVTESVTASTAAPLTEAILDESVVTLTLSGRKYEQWSSTTRSAVSVSGISAVTFPWHDPDKKSDTEITIELEFDGDITTDGILTFTVGAGAIAGYNGPALTAQVSVSAGTDAPVVTDGQTPVTPQQPVTPEQPQQPENTGGTPTLSVTTTSPLTESTLHEGIITLTLSDGTFERSTFRIRDAITLTGVSGVTVDTFGVDRVSDTQATVELAFDGNMTTDSTLSISLAADAIKDYDGTALTSQLSVSAVTESVTASTAAPLTEATLDESVVTLTLSGRKFERYNSAIRPAVSVSGISGVTVGTFDIDRESNTEITVELTFDGDITVDGTLTFTVGAGAIAGYNGPTLTAQVSVSAGTETPVVTDGQTPVTPQQPVTPEQPQQPENTGGTPTLSTSTASPLTEATLHGGIITFNLSSGTFERSPFTIRDAITLTGVSGVTVDTFGVDRVSDTQATVELAFDGNMTTDSTLSISLAADAIKDYDGTALTSQLSVSAVTESVTASTAAPLTEATLDESVVTLTLIGANYARSIFDIRDAVTVSGIDGVTFPWHQPDRESDTQISVELEFDGTDFDTTSTLTFTVGANAIAGYNGPALTAQISVTANTESVVASTASPLTEATLDESVVTLTLSGRTFERSSFKIRDAVTVSGISGVTVGTFGIDRVSDTQITVELTFDGNINADSTLTFTVGADAIVNYSGAALTAQVTVTADRENALLANYPNPFNPETWIPYRLAEDAFVTLTIYDQGGQLVRTLDIGHRMAGFYETRLKAIYWDGRNQFGEQVASGVYFYHLSAGDYYATQKMLVLK